MAFSVDVNPRKYLMKKLPVVQIVQQLPICEGGSTAASPFFTTFDSVMKKEKSVSKNANRETKTVLR